VKRKAPDANHLSAIIVNWNHGYLIEACLDALVDQDGVRFDITVVDNGSQDGSPQRIARRYPAVQLLPLATNRGFCHAFNWGVHHTRGAFVLSLNPDTVVQPGFLHELRAAASRPNGPGARTGSVAPKLLQASDPAVLDSTGLFVDRRRRPYDRGQGEVDRRQYDGMSTAFGACGAAALYRRVMLDDVAPDREYLDESFFAYGEDADLAWRAQLRGWQCAYAPGAVATHDRGWGDTLRRRGRAAFDSTGPRLALRNRYLMALKNDAWSYLLADLPRILAAELPRLGYAAVTRPRVLLGLLDLARALPRALQKRGQIQARRTVEPAALRPWLTNAVCRM
jgi:GT2 family glycosyltransferase